jgi:hypothetical protein
MTAYVALDAHAFPFLAWQTPREPPSLERRLLAIEKLDDPKAKRQITHLLDTLIEREKPKRRVNQGA